MKAINGSFNFHPDFDGETYEREHDLARLSGQLRNVRDFGMANEGKYFTPGQWEYATGANWCSVSARLRDLRKEKFGGYTVQRLRLENGLNVYSVKWDS